MRLVDGVERRGAVRCLAIVTEAFGGRGGIAQYNRDFLGALVESGIASSVIVLPRTAPDHVAVPAGIGQARPRPGRIAFATATLLAACNRRVELVFCGHLHLAPLAATIARLKNAKLIIEMHGIEAWACPSSVRRRAVETADLVLCVSRHTRAATLGWARMEPERVAVLPNTVADGFGPGEASMRRATLGLDGKRVLLTVGRLDPRERYKGHDRVIMALPELVAAGHDVAYVIVGAGGDRGYLERLAGRMGVRQRVRFLGAVPPEQLAETYRLADLFVMPSTGEGFGIAFLEAMASGVPALGLASAGARDALADGQLGTALAAGDSLAAAIARVLAAPKPAMLPERVRARFGREAFTARVDMAVNRVLNREDASVCRRQG